ncbi:hypothetical protein Q4577_15370 [Marinovum sp. 2_MG-2023]|uniref:hypothetical protein n=1 Tax=unclassified Marinovum TaxID=2647166 RepID=UPI0026E2B7B5|nr:MULTISPECIES: hypothetical protein [unclassified Marinovum]MDO6731412.1 hypothetical protein [Marinovum sp. 2_MG-2023]MDO6780689.1 hypothetical protein [Marinovum sp. 1_MG-2023]
MVRKLRPLAAAALLNAMTLSAAFASPPPAGDRAEAFAVCAGRLWALSVQQAAVGDPAHETTRRMRSDFDMLLDAVIGDAENNRQAQRWRTDGWVQMAHLLARHQYGDTARRRDMAAARMASRINTCRRMILGG